MDWRFFCVWLWNLYIFIDDVNSRKLCDYYIKFVEDGNISVNIKIFDSGNFRIKIGNKSSCCSKICYKYW